MKQFLIAFFLLFKCCVINAQASCGLLISEVLFDPPKEGSDYVELYNNTNDTILLSQYLLANRKANGDVASYKKLTRHELGLAAGCYLLITEDSAWLKTSFHLPESALVLQLAALPSWPNDEGSVVLLRASDSSVCDQLDYKDDWHFGLINRTEGVALERISFTMATNAPLNWTSASSSSGFGTPGRQNSHYRSHDNETAGVSLLPKIFSPDNDGFDDFAQLVINLPGTGFTANTVIYDASGRRVKYLLRNAVLGTHNTFRWDGDDDAGLKLPSGVYIFQTTVFNLTGNVLKFKNVIVIGKRVL